MKRHSLLLDGVREVLEDQSVMELVCKYKEKEIEEIFKEQVFKWKLEQLIQEGAIAKKKSMTVPTDLHEPLQEFLDENGNAFIKDLQLKCDLRF